MKDYANSGSTIEAQGQQRALELFHLAAEYVPAYKHFLGQNHINHIKIKSIQDFANVPVINKKNYLRAYPLKELCWNGSLQPNYIFSSSSGSTGQPFLWPRGFEQELEGALTFESIFTEFFDITHASTLYVDCFAMGTWIAGPFVLACAELLTQRGYNLQTITPGIDKEVTYALFKELASSFDQIILSGYPPFIKDLLDGGEKHDINWKNYKIKFLFAAEDFSEEWRSHIHKLVGAEDAWHTSINLYGSADAAILAHETPLTTAMRRFVYTNGKSEQLFGTNRMPTLAQYDPRLKFFEQVDNAVIFTTNAGLPLVRYSIGDEGGVVPFKVMMRQAELLGFDQAVKRRWQLPFVYVFGRSDFTVSLYGLLIYPEHIKYGLERSGIMDRISGKFVLSIEQDQKFDPYLLIRVELLSHTQPSDSIKAAIKKAVVEGLMEVNSEYARLRQEMGDIVLPTIELYEQGNQEYFRQGAKQRWVKR